MDISETISATGTQAAAETDTNAGNLTPVGGALCVDFTNTVDWRLREQPREWLTNYADVVAWSRHNATLTDAEATALLAAAAAHPDAAQGALTRARTAR